MTIAALRARRDRVAGPRPKVLVVTDPERLARRAALMLAARLIERPDLCLALPTGDTPRRLYSALVWLHAHLDLDFSRATIFNLDEYVGLPSGHPGSFAAYMREHLYGHVNVDPARVHIPDGAAPDPAREAARYQRCIERIGRLDLAIVGIGTNGHIAFNEPAEAFRGGVRVVDLARETRQQAAARFGTIERVPRQAITMGVDLILAAREVWLLASGAPKAAALARALRGTVTPRWPASALQTHARVTVLSDTAAAAGLLSKRPTDHDRPAAPDSAGDAP